MCGIVGAVSNRAVAPYLLEGLRRLEYRGYDSAGVGGINAVGSLDRTRAVGNASDLDDSVSGPSINV